MRTLGLALRSAMYRVSQGNDYEADTHQQTDGQHNTLMVEIRTSKVRNSARVTSGIKKKEREPLNALAIFQNHQAAIKILHCEDAINCGAPIRGLDCLLFLKKRG